MRYYIVSGTSRGIGEGIVRYYEKGYLAAPEETGRLIAETLDDPRISTGDHIDLRSFLSS